MPFGTEVDLGPGHIVLDGDPDPLRKGHSSLPLFGPCLLWPRLPISASAELLSAFVFKITVMFFSVSVIRSTAAAFSAL